MCWKVDFIDNWKFFNKLLDARASSEVSDNPGKVDKRQKLLTSGQYTRI